MNASRGVVSSSPSGSSDVVGPAASKMLLSIESDSSSAYSAYSAYSVRNDWQGSGTSKNCFLQNTSSNGDFYSPKSFLIPRDNRIVRGIVVSQETVFNLARIVQIKAELLVNDAVAQLPSPVHIPIVFHIVPTCYLNVE